MIPIFVQSWHRWEFTRQVIKSIRERTAPGSYRLHVLDNGSDRDTVRGLIETFEASHIDSLHVEGRNTGCLWPKHVFHAMVPQDCEYYVVTDNDFIPCFGWLEGLTGIMRNSPQLACLTLDYLPRWPLQPMQDRGIYFRTKAVGNTFKLCRRRAVDAALRDIPQSIGKYSDDGMLSQALDSMGYEVGYAKGLWCFNLENLKDNWGYTAEQVKADPRKAGYGAQVRYLPTNWETLEPSEGCGLW